MQKGHIKSLKNRWKEYSRYKEYFSKTNDVSKASFLHALKCYKKYRFVMSDYFYYRLYDHKNDNPLEYVSYYDVHDLRNLLNKEDINKIYDNKEKTYSIFKKYYKRDLLKVTKQNEEEFLKLAQKNARLIIKPCVAHGGSGIKIVNVDNASQMYAQLLEEYDGAFIAEELIKQADGMAKFHSSSINTLRVYTLRFDDEVLPHHIICRCGVGGSFIDNRTAGGIVGVVDMNSGMITAATFSDGSPVKVHPDSAENLVGAAIPKFEEAKELAMELAMVLPENRWVGWDLALTDDGWVMVEGNANPGLDAYQTTSRKGIYFDLKSYFEHLGMIDKFNEIVKR